MTTDVTEIINAISNALGIAYNKAIDLYPSVVKMNIVDEIFCFLGGLVLCFIAYNFLWKNFKKYSKENNADFDEYAYEHTGFVVIGVACAIIGFLVVCSSVCSLINWIVAPDIMSIRWVMDLMTPTK